MSPKRRSKCARAYALAKASRCRVEVFPFLRNPNVDAELLAIQEWAKLEMLRACGIGVDMGRPGGDESCVVTWGRLNGRATILSVLRQGQAERL